MDAISPFSYATTQKPANPAIARGHEPPEAKGHRMQGGLANFADALDPLGHVAQRTDELLNKAGARDAATGPSNALGLIGFMLNGAREVADLMSGAPPAPPPPPAAHAPENGTGPATSRSAYAEIMRLH